jgi:uncharacterized protein YceK
VKKVFLVIGILFALVGCGSSARPSGAEETTAVAPRGRTQMWADNCNRCHNARPASWYSRREWEVAMLHMQVRGSLTGEETRGVSEFFRAAK